MKLHTIIKLITNKQEFVLLRTSLLQYLCMGSLSLVVEFQVTEKVKGQTAQYSDEGSHKLRKRRDI